MAVRFSLDRAGIRLIGERVAEHVDQFGDDVFENMNRLVPVDTFALQNSLIVEREGEGAKRVNYIGVNPDYVQDGKRPADYVAFVENGTSTQAAQPFQAPALYQAVGR